MTGEFQTFTYLDGKSKCAPVALIDVDTPYLQRKVQAVCLKDPIFDLVIGEVEGARCKCNPDQSWKLDVIGAVTTRAQEQKMKKLSPLKVHVGTEELDVTPKLLKDLQMED